MVIILSTNRFFLFFWSFWHEIKGTLNFAYETVLNFFHVITQNSLEYTGEYFKVIKLNSFLMERSPKLLIFELFNLFKHLVGESLIHLNIFPPNSFFLVFSSTNHLMD